MDVGKMITNNMIGPKESIMYVPPLMYKIKAHNISSARSVVVILTEGL